MTTKRIVYTRSDGVVCIFSPRPGMSMEELAGPVRAEVVPPDATNVTICDVADIPIRRFRMAFRQTGPTPPVVDVALARQRRLEEIRIERVARLEKADHDLNVSDDRGDTARSRKLREHRQKLRDLPQTEQARLDALTTAEALDLYVPLWPEDPA